MATKISGFIRAESIQRWEIVRRQLLNGIKAIERMTKDPQADVDDKGVASKEIAFLRSLLEKV